MRIERKELGRFDLGKHGQSNPICIHPPIYLSVYIEFGECQGKLSCIGTLLYPAGSLYAEIRFVIVPTPQSTL